MKFGATIKSSLYSEWTDSYIDYSALKKFMKNHQASGHRWDDSDEAEFISMLTRELVKVEDFQEAKVNELTDQIHLYESSVNDLLAEKKKQAEREAEQNEQDIGYDPDSEFETEFSDDQEQRFLELEEDIEILIADVYDLGKFTHLNYTGFVKIVKKHDKRTGFELKGQFMRDYLEKHPFYKENYDALIVQLSHIYNRVRVRGNEPKGDSAAGGAQAAFVRQTTKYWVHQDNYVNLKLAILKHLPVLVFANDKEFKPDDAAISSIYFDNEDLDLYLGRLEKTEGAEAIRIRWYGTMENKKMFVERKTHHEDWTGEKSVKARFPIKEHQINDYLSGTLSMDESLRGDSKRSAKDSEGLIKLAREVQEAILKKKLCPVMRTFYIRTAFQLPGDARVRISFDTNLTLVREDNWDRQSRAGDNWRRMDIGIDWPFDQLKRDEMELFPYGVLEVKLQTHVGQEPPQWIRDLVSSHLVEAVPKFSKFCHGCASLIPHRVDLVPFWLPQMETDIRKPKSDKATVNISRPQTNTGSGQTSSVSSLPRRDTAGYTEPVSEDEDEDDPMHMVAVDESGASGLPEEARTAAAEAKKYRETNKEKDEPVESTGIIPEAITKLTKHNLSRMIDTKYNADRVEADDPLQEQPTASAIRVPEYVTSFRAQEGKRVVVPIRIEPKVYFANERTYLAWIEFSTLISAIAVTIMNFVPEDDAAGLAAGISFTIIALISICYALATFMWRAIMIRNRRAVAYDDRYGPTFLCILLLLAVVINIIFRFSEGEHPKTRSYYHPQYYLG